MMRDSLRDDRLHKLKKIDEAQIVPYPARAKRTITASDARSRFHVLRREKKQITIAGRIVSIRDQGGVMFIDLRDETGTFQLVFKKETFTQFNFFKEVLDRGDFISAKGTLFLTKRKERSVDVVHADILAKSIAPIPGEWYGIEETELRLRKRYLDMLLHEDVRDMIRKKSAFWSAFRDVLVKEGFLETENPVLEPLPGGAEAEPFTTHHRALDTTLYLRISLELPLKKLLVGGFEKVFEIGRIFRNEGIDKEHLQDYTQLEFYWAYADYRVLMKFVEQLYKQVIKKTIGGLVSRHEGKEVHWEKKWPVVKYVDVMKERTGIDPRSASHEELLAKASSLGLSPLSEWGKGRLIDVIFKKAVRPTLWSPCFLIDPPVEIEPLAKRSEEDSRLVERFQVMACGTELGKGFSELNDPIDQRARFEEQMRLREAGDKEAQQLDEDFLEALSYGMPPAAGFGVSERLFAVLVDKPIRETVTFPSLRPPSS